MLYIWMHQKVMPRDLPLQLAGLPRLGGIYCTYGFLQQRQHQFVLISQRHCWILVSSLWPLDQTYKPGAYLDLFQISCTYSSICKKVDRLENNGSSYWDLPHGSAKLFKVHLFVLFCCLEAAPQLGHHWSVHNAEFSILSILPSTQVYNFTNGLIVKYMELE